jgi:hypothetical protein
VQISNFEGGPIFGGLTITLSCISHCYKIRFEALKSEYYAIKKKYSSGQISKLRNQYEFEFQYYSNLIQSLQSLF